MRGSDIAGENQEDLLDDSEEVSLPRRPWLLILVSPLLAILALWAGLEWRNGLERENRLRAELKQVYLEAETLRLQAAQAGERGALLERQLRELAAEKEELASRLEAQVKATKGRRPPTKATPSPR